MFVISSAMCGLAQGIREIVVFRLIQGAAGAAMIPLSQAILLETFPVEEHTLAMTTFGIGMMVAPVLGPTLGGWITINWNWRWIFYVNIPIEVFAAVMVYAFVHESPGGGRLFTARTISPPKNPAPAVRRRSARAREAHSRCWAAAYLASVYEEALAKNGSSGSLSQKSEQESR
jgi:MFS family permease